MSDAASTYLESKLLDHVLNYSTAPYTDSNLTTIYVGLLASGGNDSALSTALEGGTSGTASTGDWGYYEITGNAYTRRSVGFASASSGSISSNTTVEFPVATGDYDTAGSTGNTVTHIALFDGSTGGNVLFYGQLATSKTVSSGDQFTITSGNLTITLS
jgi:hypothetical protein